MDPLQSGSIPATKVSNRIPLKVWDRSTTEQSRNDKPNGHLQKTSPVKQIFLYQLHEYLDNSVLHGVKYLGDSSRALIERLWWAVSILFSLVGISVLIFRVWDRWTTSPVIVSFSESPTPIWQIPFPAVTVCPQTKYNRSLFNFQEMKERRGNISQEDEKMLHDVSLICRDIFFDKFDENEYPEFTDQSAVDNLIKVAYDLDIVQCNYQYNSTCSSSLQRIVTRDGVCFTFNQMPNNRLYSEYTVQGGGPSRDAGQSLWSLEDGYLPIAGMDGPPLRAAGTGFQMALKMLLKTDKLSLDYQCSHIQGFKVSLNNPVNAPRMMEKFFYIPMSGLTQLVVEPRVMETTEALRTYTPEKRHCYFPSERKLAYFTTYTQNNCDLECLTNITLERCGCVDFYMPRYATTPICGLGKTKCMLDRESQMYIDAMYETIQKVKSNYSCNCIPECKSINYNAEASQGTYEVVEVAKARNISIDSYKNFHVNYLFVFFKDTEFYASKRDELYGYADFMANCGGLLGLCCGFSILSLVEIVYYFTLRLWVNFRRQRQETEELNTHTLIKKKILY